MRFYKSASERLAVHVGNLWTATGTLLATVDFSQARATIRMAGSVTLPLPVPITAGTQRTSPPTSHRRLLRDPVPDVGSFATEGVDQSCRCMRPPMASTGPNARLFASARAACSQTFDALRKPTIGLMWCTAFSDASRNTALARFCQALYASPLVRDPINDATPSAQIFATTTNGHARRPRRQHRWQHWTVHPDTTSTTVKAIACRTPAGHTARSPAAAYTIQPPQAARAHF